ncbi:hypothetical protein P7K49_006552 [Saguinus oedipus]|uniref:Fatty acid desaturase domain-containing protein n=1 Tax=Saguinus oedipus TaxID=9490 RepID=A0ABQ9W3I1_SAGOE|nr:hypothetical protein P7K49_006552 [Saguinus oedipus]
MGSTGPPSKDHGPSFPRGNQLVRWHQKVSASIWNTCAVTLPMMDSELMEAQDTKCSSKGTATSLEVEDDGAAHIVLDKAISTQHHANTKRKRDYQDTAGVRLQVQLISIHALLPEVEMGHQSLSWGSSECYPDLQPLLPLYLNDIFEWSRDHRVHHKYSETDADPHNARRGFFFSHIGWLFVRKHRDVIEKGRKLDVTDLLADPVVRIQRKENETVQQRASKHSYALILSAERTESTSICKMKLLPTSTQRKSAYNCAGNWLYWSYQLGCGEETVLTGIEALYVEYDRRGGSWCQALSQQSSVLAILG